MFVEIYYSYNLNKNKMCIISDCYEDYNDETYIANYPTNDTIDFQAIFNNHSSEETQYLLEKEEFGIFQNEHPLFHFIHKKKGRHSHTTIIHDTTSKIHTKITKDNIIRKIKISYLHLFLIPLFNSLIKLHFGFQKYKLCKLAKQFVNITDKKGIISFGNLLIQDTLSNKITSKCYRKDPKINKNLINHLSTKSPFNYILRLTNKECYQKMFLEGNTKIDDQILIDNDKILTFTKWIDKLRTKGESQAYLNEITKYAFNFFLNEK